MDVFFPSGDPASFTALFMADPNRPDPGRLPTQRKHRETLTARRISLCVVNGAGGLVSVLEFDEDRGPEQVLAAAGWYRTESWRHDAAGRQWARIEAADRADAHPNAPASATSGAS